MNLIKDLGYLALGTRFRIMTDRLLQDVDKVYKSLDVDFEPRWFTVFYLINLRKSVTVTAIAVELGYTQPAVTQILNILLDRGLVKAVKEKEDSRKKILTVTPKGKELFANLQPVWNIIEESVKDFFLSTGYDMLTIFDKIESELDNKDIYSRIEEKMKILRQDGVSIIPFQPKFRDHFRGLNYDWISKYFRIEDYDKQVLENPENEILDKGGSVFFADYKGDIVGTVALLKHPDGSLELTKMAVKEEYRGKHIGEKLALEVIDKARAMNVDCIFLETNPTMSVALNLYRKLGFEEIEYDQPPKYERSTIRMRLKFDKDAIATNTEVEASN